MSARDHVIRATVLGEIADERRRQVEAEGWTPEHDDEHNTGGMAQAAACYAMAARWWQAGWHPTSLPDHIEWPWARKWWKPKAPRQDLIRAAALIVAEIERLDRAHPSKPNGDPR